MRDAQPRTVYLSEYRPPEFLVDSVHLRLHLDAELTLVQSRLQLRRNPAAVGAGGTPLLLDGAGLELRELRLDGEVLPTDRYRVEGERLRLDDVPEQFSLECLTAICPRDNASLEGLYISRDIFCTQCEAEGFRKITYYPDRPDVLSVFTVTLEADRERYPVLLSNGNLVAEEALPGGRHAATWHDPFPKPSYLFALVAGRLEPLQDRFLTASGREVSLRIYVEPKDLDKLDHAMDSLKRSMRWDEEVYGLEYDLDVFNIVAVDDFNMGAMENKSLNIFNTSCVLARPETTTDAGFQRVEAVVAHEYFHNWSGNRVTCRDWFQLSLKEGFTVFRDACFSADMGSPTVKRVEDVQLLRTLQFAEDAGPMAHPVRPDAYMEISNFYTVTIYEKGAEVVRMLHTLLGAGHFREGCDLYFRRFDGQAVTCDDFVDCMQAASGRDLSQFRRWYSQAGTPQLQVDGHYNAERQTYTLTVSQYCAPTPGQAHKDPLHIPLRMALLGEAGALPLRLQDQPADAETSDNTECVLELTRDSQSFVFENVAERPVPSLLRGFSAPVRLETRYSRDDLLFLMRNDSDGFSRWDAGQQLAVLALRDMVAAFREGRPLLLDPRLVEASAAVLEDDSLDPAMVALMLQLPSEAWLAELSEEVDVVAIHAAREAARLALARALQQPLWQVWRRHRDALAGAPYAADAAQVAARSLANTALSCLMALEDDAAVNATHEQFLQGGNMTDVFAALGLLVNSSRVELAQEALEQFLRRWRDEPLVVNQWFQVQATCRREGSLERVQALLQHPAYDARNPNKIRALVGAFCQHNPLHFHREDGEGYRFLADQVIALDSRNPQIAARLLGPLSKWRRYPASARARMRGELQRIAEQPALSPDVFEVVSKSLVD